MVRHLARVVNRRLLFSGTGFCFLTFLIAFSSRSGFAQEAATNDSPPKKQSAGNDLEEIRAGSRAFILAFNKRDPKAVAALWTENGEYIDDTGQRHSGRVEIQKGYAKFFADNKPAEITILIDSLRLLSDQVAIEEGRAVVEPAPASVPGISKYVVVHEKVKGRWLMASVRDTRIETPSAYKNVADLEWLIGTWTAEENGTTLESVCRWVANKSFVQRSYTTTQADGTKTSGMQLIGWNAQGGHVQSWNFSPEGGHALGIWSPTEGGWVAEMRGVTGDGTPTASVNLLKRLDDNAYVWKSVWRTIGDIAIPDTDEVVLKRHSAAR